MILIYFLFVFVICAFRDRVKNAKRVFSLFTWLRGYAQYLFQVIENIKYTNSDTKNIGHWLRVVG